jgi:hypothetical protein
MCSVDLLIILLLLPWWPLVTWIKESGSGLWGLNAYISDYQQIGHRFRLLHGNLIDSFDIAEPIVKGIDDFDVLDVWDNILGTAEIFHTVPEAFIMLLLDNFQSFNHRWMFVCALKVPMNMAHSWSQL